MTLRLNHQQRLNLTAVLNAQPFNGRELHAIWHLQDLLELSDDEKTAIEFRTERVDEQEIYRWNLEKSIPDRSFEISDADIMRIQKAIDQFAGFVPLRDRPWLEPLLAQLLPLETRNGSSA